MDDSRKRAILLSVAFALPLLFIMVIFITTFIPATRLSIGWPASLILLGFIIIGIGYFSISLNRKYLKQ